MPSDIIQDPPNLNAQLIETSSDGQLYLTFNFLAHKEKLLRETLSLLNTNTQDVISIQFHARVLGKTHNIIPYNHFL